MKLNILIFIIGFLSYGHIASAQNDHDTIVIQRNVFFSEWSKAQTR